MKGTIGPYNILVGIDGQYAIEWFIGKQRYIVRVSNLVDKLHNIVQNEMVAREHFIMIYKLAFGKNSENFFEHPDSIIMDYLETNETIPEKQMNKAELSEFNIKRFLLAYNRWKGTCLKFKEVEPFCKHISNIAEERAQP